MLEFVFCTILLILEISNVESFPFQTTLTTRCTICFPYIGPFTRNFLSCLLLQIQAFVIVQNDLAEDFIGKGVIGHLYNSITGDLESGLRGVNLPGVGRWGWNHRSGQTDTQAGAG